MAIQVFLFYKMFFIYKSLKRILEQNKDHLFYVKHHHKSGSHFFFIRPKTKKIDCPLQ